MNSIDATIKTPQLYGASRPFGAINMPKKPSKPATYVDPESLEICDDVMPAQRAYAGNKYETKFAAMKLGQALKVAPTDIGKVANSMRKWIRDSKVNAHVRSISVLPGCPAKLGRVWLMAGPQPSASLPAKTARH